MRKIAEITEVNEHGYIGYRFDDSKRFASSRVREDLKGKYIISQKEKYYIHELENQLKADKDNHLVQEINGWKYYRSSTDGKMIAYYRSAGEQLIFETDKAFENWLEAEKSEIVE